MYTIIEMFDGGHEYTSKTRKEADALARKVRRELRLTARELKELEQQSACIIVQDADGRDVLTLPVNARTLSRVY